MEAVRFARTAARQPSCSVCSGFRERTELPPAAGTRIARRPPGRGRQTVVLDSFVFPLPRFSLIGTPSPPRFCRPDSPLESPKVNESLPKAPPFLNESRPRQDSGFPENAHGRVAGRRPATLGPLIGADRAVGRSPTARNCGTDARKPRTRKASLPTQNRRAPHGYRVAKRRSCPQAAATSAPRDLRRWAFTPRLRRRLRNAWTIFGSGGW